MPWRVSKKLRASLLEEVETGMGYQVATINGGRYVILNAELAFELPQYDRNNAEDSSPRPADRLRADDLDWLKDQLPEYLAKKGKPLTQGLRRLDCAEHLEVETHGSYPSNSSPGELFVRYSAFRQDRRIDPDFSVKPGTYVTTATDAPHVPSGLAAVGRYALPVHIPAVHKFTLTPRAPVPITCGATAPRFGQAGGGVEVLFINSLPAGTAMGPVLIPER